MQAITRDELIGKLLGTSGATFATITATTDARAKKTGNPFGKIFKEATVNGCLNFHYDAGVERRLAKEGKTADEFKKGESWHEPVLQDGNLTPLCQHKTDKSKVYVRFMLVQKVGETIYREENGREIPADQVKPFLPKPSGYANQGLDNPLVILTYDLDNVDQLTIGGETYKLVERRKTEAA